MVCPVCGAESRRIFRVKEKYDVCQCDACTHRFADCEPGPDHVAAIYGDDYFFGGGAGYPDYLEEEAILRAHGRRYADLLDRYIPQSEKRLLDVGGASGFVSDGFRARGWRPQLIEPNGRMAAYARERLHLDSHEGTLDDFRCGEKFDVVTMIQVIAHFPNPRQALSRAAELTRDKGYWLVETWNSSSLTARLFGKHWHEYNPPSVLHFFTTRSLRTLAGQYGFVAIASGHPRKNIQWRHARTLLDHQIGAAWFRRITGLLRDDAVLPYPAEDLRWTLFQRESSRANALSAA